MLKKIYTTAILALVLASGCKKDPGKLVGPTNAYSTNNYPASIDDLQSVLASCYSNMRDPGYLGFHYLPKAISNSTHVVNSVYNGDPSWNDMAANNVNAGNEYSTEAWTVLYTGVKNCNVLIAGAKLYNEKYGKPADGNAVNYILGQAYFLRGYYYFQLECLFGESYMGAGGAGGEKMGVPIFSDVPPTLAATQQPRASVKDTWAFIEGDFKQAATLLKGKTWPASDAGRVTEWTAKGMLGKAYVFTQDWANAKSTLNDVIQNSGKTLMPFAKYKNAFNGNSANEFNEESLFELNIDPDSKGGYGVYSGAANSTAINGLIWCPWVLGGDGTEGGAFPLGYGNEFFHDKNILRFGYSIGSTYDLVPNPAFDASKPASYSNPAKVMDPVYRAKAVAVRTNKTADPRLFVNALQPWLDSVKFDGVNTAPVSKPNFDAGNTSVYGWSLHKYAPTLYNENSGQGNPGGIADAWNYYLLRMADIYLLYAEAAINAGDAAGGLEYLNKVKRRAYGYPINGASPVDYASTTAATVAIGDPVLGNNPLYYERWAELLNEGHWWFDVCRWRIGKSEAAYFGSAINVNGALSFDENKAYVWPIPTNEINTNSKVKQNPGY